MPFTPTLPRYTPAPTAIVPARDAAGIFEALSRIAAILNCLTRSGQVRQINSGEFILSPLTAEASLNFGSIAAHTTAALTITVTGAAVGDAVTITPATAPEVGLVWCGYVSAADTVTVRLGNVTTGAIDPAAVVYRCDVFKQSS